jgi:thiamine biosynthesis lipoprotein
MRQTELIMGMPITVEIIDSEDMRLLRDAFEYFRVIDGRYSTYKPDSEISRINDGLPEREWSAEMRHVLELCEETKRQTNGYFDIWRDGTRDPSGLVKGWAIDQAAKRLHSDGVRNFYIEAGGDVQAMGVNAEGQPWSIGIRNPFDRDEIIKVLHVQDAGVATSGTYIRGQHIYDPHRPDVLLESVASLTVVSENIYDADRFATAAFAMGKDGIGFIEQKKGLEGYMVDSEGIATMTSGFEEYVHA